MTSRSQHRACCSADTRGIDIGMRHMSLKMRTNMAWLELQGYGPTAMVLAALGVVCFCFWGVQTVAFPVSLAFMSVMFLYNAVGFTKAFRRHLVLKRELKELTDEMAVRDVMES